MVKKETTGRMPEHPEVNFSDYGDVRYLPKTAVQYEKPAANNFTVRVNETTNPLPPAASPAPLTTPAGMDR